MDSTIYLNEIVEKKGFALSQHSGGKTHKQHVLQYYSKKQYFYERWLKFIFNKERLHGRYFQIKLGNNFTINQRISFNMEDARVNKISTTKLSTAMRIN